MPKKEPDKRNPELQARRAARLKALAAKKAEALSIADRLTRRALERTIDLKFTDSEGEFEVKVHVPLTDEFNYLIKLISGYNPKITGEQADQLTDELYQLFAHLCVDDSLNYEFWKEGAYDAGDFYLILQQLVDKTAGFVTQAQSFRKH